MQLEKQDDGTWALKNQGGETVGTLSGQDGEWLARAGGRTIGICRSRKTAEIVLRAHLAGNSLRRSI